MTYDLIIVGGGPAGITASIYASRKQLKTLLITSDFIGQVGLTGPIENWPGEPRIKGSDLAEKFEQHLREQDLDILEEPVTSITAQSDTFKVATEDEEFSARATLLATGRKPRQLNVPGEQEFIGKGVVYCTTCDAPIYKDKKVIIVGGGNYGFASAIEMTDYASDVSLLESSDSFSADGILQQRAKAKGVKTYTDLTVTEIIGDEFVTAAKLSDDTTEPVDGVFIDIGSLPNTDIAPEEVHKNDQGEIIIDPQTNQTNVPGLYAAGDATDIPYKQIVTSTGEGAKAALSIYDYLQSQ